MKKKIMASLLLGLCICLMLTGCSIEKLTEPKIKYKLDDKQAIVTKVPNKSTVKQIVIPDEYEGLPVCVIEDFSATNLENVEKIVIGKNVKEIGSWAFENNQKLKEFDVDEGNQYYCDVDGVLFTKDMKTILFYPPNKDLKNEQSTDGNGQKVETQYNEYEIPMGVEKISTKAFYKCQKLKTIDIPETVKSIDEKAFFRCSNLENVKLPSSLRFIGKDAFSYCTIFTHITIPKAVEKIDTYAFYNCKNLLDIVILADENSITLEEKWYPTDNGKKIDELKISYKTQGIANNK